MLGNYEKRRFVGGEKIWIGRYKNLTNVLHWHFECEIIRMAQGCAQIKIGEHCFSAKKGDCFFCAGEQLHYIIGEQGSEIDIMILDEAIAKDITDKYMLLSPKLPADIPPEDIFVRIKNERSQRGVFYREAIENLARGLIVEIFQKCNFVPRDDKVSLHKKLVAKINSEYSFITFEDAVRYSGYSSSHFSKMFKQLSGMNFSQYLNIIKVENAILLLRQNNSVTMTSVSVKCGFSTVRNFNRVFKNITGYSPRMLPKDFIMDVGLRIVNTDRFDPTDERSVLL